MSEWKKHKIKDIAEIISGSTPSTSIPEFWDGEVPWITPKDLSTHKYRHISRGERNISTLGVQKTGLKPLPINTVLITSRAPIGYIALSSAPVTTNQGFKNLIINKEHNPSFFYYLAKTLKTVFENNAGVTTFREISSTAMGEIPVILPTRETQDKIAKTLNILDEKIELNHRLNDNLAHLAA